MQLKKENIVQKSQCVIAVPAKKKEILYRNINVVLLASQASEEENCCLQKYQCGIIVQVKKKKIVSKLIWYCCVTEKGKMLYRNQYGIAIMKYRIEINMVFL